MKRILHILGFVLICMCFENIFGDNSTEENTEKSLIVHPLQLRNGRAMENDHGYEYDHGHSDHDAQEEMKMMTEEKESRKTENWGSQYYDFLINEGSYKFWAVFQLVTAALLIYSAFAAIYYAKFNLVTADYDYDYFYGRSFDSEPVTASPWLGLSSQTFQNILNAISSNRYT
ncbi:uncharacterized protein LOC123303023 [Chrysoperla carnea]|uniref:uncharacterized protein LOC123303023 n=1 Tax=Chrysoperla carnea TaxID=189513 RepID=UPI001D088BD6|nr:uncharacterized protein LOC123303023 [Chrysoperla carnea]